MWTKDEIEKNNNFVFSCADIPTALDSKEFEFLKLSIIDYINMGMAGFLSIIFSITFAWIWFFIVTVYQNKRYDEKIDQGLMIV